MGELLGIGLSHYPPLCGADANMSGLLRYAMDDDSIPRDKRDPANWSGEMRSDWSDDGGLAAAAIHRQQLVEQFRKVRADIDEFAPDVLLIVGDDQYENFREGVVPAYTVLAYQEDIKLQPWRNSASSAMVGETNVWDEPSDTTIDVRMAPQFGRDLASGLLERGVDAAYAYVPNHYEGLSHAFANALLYLDYDRKGMDYPVLPLAVNCYGRWVLGRKGFVARFDDGAPLDPPSPSPARMMQVGAAIAETVLASDKRVALVASSSWSHAFLCDKTYRIRPDRDADDQLYEMMIRNDFEALRSQSLSAIEQAGQHEVLNWFALWGAMEQAQMDVDWSSIVHTDVFNSNKVFATYR